MIRIYSVGVWNCKILENICKSRKLEFTPLEFETHFAQVFSAHFVRLEFTPLEFETIYKANSKANEAELEFTPLEFETTRTLNLSCLR